MRGCCALLSTLLLCACSSPSRDPVATLMNGALSNMVHHSAMKQLEATPRDDDTTIDVLQGLIYRSGYDVDVRRRGLELLIEIDRPRLVRTLRQRLPRITDKPWLRQVCNWIAQQDWSPAERETLEEALISSWGRAWTGGMPEAQRPEYQAMAEMVGEDQLVDFVWGQLLRHDNPSEESYRHRCWELLHRLGARGRLMVALQELSMDESSNPMLKDLHEAAAAFGTVPWNREEILWLRKLQEPERRTFWTQAQGACAAMPEARRTTLRIRDLPIVVAAMRHRPDLAGSTRSAMAQQLERRLQRIQHYSEENAYYKNGRFVEDRVHDHIDDLSWGDLAAITLALDALDVVPVLTHLFDYADRDNAETSTEFGGVIALDGRGRYEIQEFHPRVRHHDLRFNAPQEMFDAAYTGLFHFHFHATTHRNREHAGPGLGDLTYADTTRANCLVLTFIDEDTLNVDWYRHDGVVVDLGCVQRPGRGQG